MSATLAQTTRRVAVFVGLLFAALLVNVNVLQVVRADTLAQRPGNTRTTIEQFSQPRGPIVVADTPVAQSVPNEGRIKFQRTYGRGPLYAPATGFLSLVYGATGIERAEDAVLSGSDPRIRGASLADLIVGRSRAGGSVVLTLDPAAQQAAFDGLRGRRGAVVALDPTTGAILALASSPSYDPNQLASLDPDTEAAAWRRLNADAAQPLLNRPLAQLYAPGSTFKVVTTAAALSSGKYTPTTLIPAPAAITLPGTSVQLPNYNRRPCGDGQVTLAEALRVSCNTAFANVGISLGDDALRRQAEAFGWGTSFATPLVAATSRFPENPDAAQTALSAIGQYDVRATALQMAMVSAGIANRGEVMRPYLVQQLRAPDRSVLEQAQPQRFGQAVTPEVAQQVSDMMVLVVEAGTGVNARIPGVTVAGKTGTAQNGPGRPADAWFISFAPAENPQVAVAVIVEGAGNPTSEISGGRLAAPIARAVMEAVLRP